MGIHFLYSVHSFPAEEIETRPSTDRPEAAKARSLFHTGKANGLCAT